MTRHAARRAQQRAIPPMAIDLLLRFGRSEKAGDGCTRVYLDKTSHRRLRAYAGRLASHLHDYLGIYAVVAGDQHVVTVAHRIERIRRN
ncbi:MAG: hypothetical protein KBC73_22005 [Burkholderiaceae bacterium]|nr:hypothetical protein [Burkholderiaceae bacterium]